jgi:hypothetical protein
MTALPPDFLDLLKCLNSAGVRYLLIGGHAVNFYGYHRSTADLDLWIAVERENAARVSAALQAFGFLAESVPASLFEDVGPVFTFGRKPLRVDILTKPSGVEFDECYANRVETTFGGVPATVIGREDLVRNKRAAGRDKDVEDWKKLTPGQP